MRRRGRQNMPVVFEVLQHGAGGRQIYEYHSGCGQELGNRFSGQSAGQDPAGPEEVSGYD